ncbi:ATP-binding protein [Chloroflexi bacterium TSY]|nr:ATP-binding protein [Chloroflexi bacterium TSY]
MNDSSHQHIGTHTIQQLQRQLMERVNEAFPQEAFSTDGRTFGYQARMTLRIPVGCYVTLHAGDDTIYLGQIIKKETLTREGPEVGLDLNLEQKSMLPEGVEATHFKNRIRIRALEGTGVLLGKLAGNDIVSTNNTDIFQNAEIALADPVVVSRYLALPGSSASLPVGSALFVDGYAPTYLRASGFNRHTFLCGQSGSGKTFALGIILEQLLLNTNLRIVILDPNSDFVNLDQMISPDQLNHFRREPLAAEEYERLAKRYRTATDGVKILRPKGLTDSPEQTLRVRFADLEPQEQATVLQLDPLIDRQEFNTFWKIVDQLAHDYTLADVRNAVAHDYTAEARQIGLRSDDWRCLVLDIGMLGSFQEKSVVANAMFGHFWRNRNQRAPVLLVIDEAHNICADEPVDELDAISTEHAIRIAGEGRKFGLYMLVASQRPSKIHDNVLSQCDNLVLMRMNSATDLNHLAALVSHVPNSLLQQALNFSQGESLLAGRIVANPTFTHFEGRMSVEGGSDVATTWAENNNIEAHL